MFFTMAGQPDHIYTVTAVNRMAKHVIEESFPNVWVEGEISNYHHHGSGHRYFSLKDDECQLRCAMWRSSAAGLKFEPKDGLKVIANGSLTIYDRGGSYQLSVRRMLPAGMGELELAFRQLRDKLEKEGLFLPELKKPLPEYPMKIGVVTSPTGAVIHDIIRVVRHRNPKIDIILWPCEVQGDVAPSQLAAGIEALNEFGGVDVIIIGRGGGSLEDLWGFNDERVVRAVFHSKIPVIAAVGHEVDITLTDLAADYSAATPSMAAEMASWRLTELQENLRSSLEYMRKLLRDIYIDKRQELVDLVHSPQLSRPETMLTGRYQYLDHQIRLLHLQSGKRFDTFRKSAGLHISRLEALSPLAVLSRGYSVSRHYPDQRVVRSVGDIEPGTEIETIVTDGAIFSTVGRIEKKK